MSLELIKQPLLIVVDDEDEILSNYRELFSDSYRLKAYQNPTTLLNDMDQKDFENPALIITDLKMPGMDGLQMVQKAQEKGFFFPFILLSGYLNKESAIEALDRGAFRLLEKPTEFSVLSETIDQLLIEHETHEVRREIRTLTSQLRELYSHYRLILGQYVPEDVLNRLIVDAPEGQVKSKHNFESVLDQLEERLDTLLRSEVLLNEMRQNKLRA